MKRSFTIILIALLSLTQAIAQQTDSLQQESTTIYSNGNGNRNITARDGGLSFNFNGIRLGVNGGQHRDTIRLGPYYDEPEGDTRVRFGVVGMGSPSFNHFALIELGSNMLVNTNYSSYTPDEEAALMFGNHKSVNCNINLMSLNAPLNRRHTLVVSMAFGFALENYSFANPVTMELRDGMLRPIQLDPSIKKSKLRASYVHIPVVLDWNINRGFFISAGFNFDILMSSALKYKFPKTKINRETGLAPIQAGVTARIGWRRLYAYFNYSLVDMYRRDVGPSGHRLSAGMGISF